MSRVNAPIVSCPVCGEPSSIWAPVHPACSAETPCVGEKFRDALAERAIATLADNEDAPQ